MRSNRSGMALGAAVIALALPGVAAAQTTADDLMAMGIASLRGEVQQRYDAALALTQDAGVVSADTSQYMWASQAKAQCGIALGFLKSSTKDPVSIGKCVDAAERMKFVPPPPPPPPLVPDTLCSQPVAGIVFFDWDSAVPGVDASQTLDSVVNNFNGCGWSGLVVTGHTDRSGSDAYNDVLSVARANAIADLLGAKGLAAGQMAVSGRGEGEPKVPTLDGERNPTNRRVEVTVQ
ncbi:MAG: OmpA family protein [Sphingomonadaceae bacterium]|nr:OmpA family protein [Sphingomonadaceae bacterium]